MLLLHFLAATQPSVGQGYHLSICPNFRGRLYLLLFVYAEAYWAWRSLIAEGVTLFFICNALCAAWWIALYFGRQRLRRHVMVDQ